jgi:hypothetical protein
MLEWFRAEAERFLLEALAAVRVRRELRREDLDGHIAPETRIPRAVDLPHPSRAQRRENLEGAKTRSRRQCHVRAAGILTRFAVESRPLEKEKKMKVLRLVVGLFLFAAVALAAGPAPVVAVKVGRLIDPKAGQVLTGVVILVENGRVKAVGPSVAIPPDAKVIDLSSMTVRRA